MTLSDKGSAGVCCLSRVTLISRRVCVSLCWVTILLCSGVVTAWVGPTSIKSSTSLLSSTGSTINPHRFMNQCRPPNGKQFIRSSMRLEARRSSSPQVEAIMSSGLEPDELSLLMEVISHECQQLGVSCDDRSMHSMSAPVVTLSATGALGRVLLFRASGFGEDGDSELLEDLEGGICEQMDLLLCGSQDEDDDDDLPMLNDPILICFQTNDELELKLSQLELNKDDNEYCTRYLSAIVAQHVQEYEMASPLPIVDVKNKQEEKSLVPSIHVEIDGGYVSYPLDTEPFWDASTLLVFDNLVGQDLRKRLLDVVIGDNSDHHDARNGPDPGRWVRGGLLDVPDANEDPQQELEESEDGGGGGWGLTDEALEEIYLEQHDAVQEMESILSNLFPDFLVSRLPETVLGCSVTPMTANAPTAGDVFDYHIDADPNITPSSPWTDVYGRYPNRAPGKPRFMSCLIYLNDEWDGDLWGAPTRFVDVPTDDELDRKVYDVTACPGRCIIMDQDIGHTVVAPIAAAGKRPRYSLVWKLILHPKTIGQDMKQLAGGRKSLWPETEYFGSAAQNHDVMYE